MDIDFEENFDSEKGLKRISKLLESRFDISICFDSSDEYLQTIYEHYLEKKNNLLVEHGEYKAINMNEYAKSFLICEAIRLFLREIAPKRRNKKRNMR